MATSISCIVDVPMHDVVQILNSFIQIMCGHKLGNYHLGDYCDGSEFHGHASFAHEPKALQLMLYFDELEVCNPLGTKTNTHKSGDFVLHKIHIYYYINYYFVLSSCVCTGIFYYMLGNISPQFLSQLKAIQLLSIAKSSIILK